ncbi:hypothetical protein BEWA_036780 [Theileria equi strain WA]|uniref:Uncharacterized protein n=1 Tax=Theileria equi strain WA TaxID=1537102 RepID=L1LAJ2_THEEQ|nr:hypothetical protein BEWA_047240 [Theileria equi strain WA]XP_004833094.1 hypothetical protein BEWA_036780 [Theileria equi strain WA]EKX72259.1 hypothetical protein BEWA_047240 [Theileria equi strain WA]EKX73642.1 hypothetical protein BEWA_036780 [Theileria equi strain WA]|eukprot:XP_004831711.1 hypothetical protein BEWA_047240 [Theileria equi strain WA]
MKEDYKKQEEDLNKELTKKGELEMATADTPAETEGQDEQVATEHEDEQTEAPLYQRESQELDDSVEQDNDQGSEEDEEESEEFRGQDVGTADDVKRVNIYTSTAKQDNMEIKESVGNENEDTDSDPSL